MAGKPSRGLSMSMRQYLWANWLRCRSHTDQALRYERLAVRLFILADALDEGGREKAAGSMREVAYRFRVRALCQGATVHAMEALRHAGPSQPLRLK
jgi:hypothetical protein